MKIRLVMLKSKTGKGLIIMDTKTTVKTKTKRLIIIINGYEIYRKDTEPFYIQSPVVSD